MLEIAKSNSKTSNNSVKLAIAILAISIAKLAATTLAILIIAALLKLATITPLKRGAYKAARGCVASSAS
jgi:hypothetical protein